MMPNGPTNFGPPNNGGFIDSLERRVSSLEQGQRNLLPVVSRVNTTVQHLKEALERFEAAVTDVSDRVNSSVDHLNKVNNRLVDLEDTRNTALAVKARRKRMFNKIFIGVAIAGITALISAVVTAINMHVR